MNIPQHSLAAVTMQRVATITQARVRGQQLRNKQLRNKQLLEAAESGDISEVENLLARGADINASSKIRSCREGIYGITALYWAVRQNSEDIVKLLLKAGAKTDVIDSLGDTPLHCAAYFGSADNVQALVIAGADVNATNNDGKTVLHWSMDRGYYKVTLAIEAGKKKLISLYENQQCQLKTLVNSPIHECESLREPLLQNKPEKLNETQIQQAIKYRKEKKIRNYKFFNKNNFSSIKFFKINP